MRTKTREIPLFPLPTVLFPGTFLALEVSDPRHRALVQSCATDCDRLGVVLAPGTDNGRASAVPCTTGCLASVAIVLESEEAAPLGVVLYGEHRIRIKEYTVSDHGMRGRVDVLAEFTGLHAERRTKQAAALFTQYIDLIRARYQADVTSTPLPSNPTMASYLLASVLYLPSEIKQRWLETSSAAVRLEEEAAYLRAECDKLTTLLALSRHSPHEFAPPDFHRYTHLISDN